MAVDAVVAGVELAADEPFPEGRIGGVESLAPGLVPIEEGSGMVVAFFAMLRPLSFPPRFGQALAQDSPHHQSALLEMGRRRQSPHLLQLRRPPSRQPQ